MRIIILHKFTIAQAHRNDEIMRCNEQVGGFYFCTSKILTQKIADISEQQDEKKRGRDHDRKCHLDFLERSHTEKTGKNSSMKRQ